MSSFHTIVPSIFLVRIETPIADRIVEILMLDRGVVHRVIVSGLSRIERRKKVYEQGAAPHQKMSRWTDE